MGKTYIDIFLNHLIIRKLIWLEFALDCSLQNVCNCVDKSPRWPSEQDIGPYGEMIFSSSKTKKLIESKLYLNNHWMIPYTICFSVSN